MFVGEHLVSTAMKERVRKNVKEVVPCHPTLGPKTLFPGGQQAVSASHGSYRILHLGHFFGQGARFRAGCGRGGPDSVGLHPVLHHGKEPVVIVKGFVHLHLIGHPQIDEQGAGEAGRKAQQIEPGKAAVLYEVTPGYFEVVLEHALCTTNKTPTSYFVDS